MESHQPHGIEVEIGALVLRYAHTRIVKPKALTLMSGSMERFGQINPVLVVVEDRLFVLIDGYLRVLSLTRLGRDTVMAEVCQDTELKALFRLLSRTGERQWEAIEQAWIVRDIRDRFGCTASEMARSVGHDLSWVSKRLALLEALSDEVLQAVCQGHVSTWAATRVLVPLARANPRRRPHPLSCQGPWVVSGPCSLSQALPKLQPTDPRQDDRSPRVVFQNTQIQRGKQTRQRTWPGT